MLIVDKINVETEYLIDNDDSCGRRIIMLREILNYLSLLLFF